MTPSGNNRELIEAAAGLLLVSAPAGWTRMVAEFVPTASSASARAHVVGPWGSSPLPIPDGAQEFVTEYQRRELALGAAWHQIVIECDNTGSLRVRTDAQPDERIAARATKTPVWLWLVTAAAVALLVVAVAGRDGDATLHAIPASESMSDAEARVVAEKTLLAWTRERNAGHFANLDALTCPGAPESWVSRQLQAVSGGEPPAPFDLAATAVFTRNGPEWTLNATSRDRGGTFTMRIVDGELRVCELRAAPVP